MKRLTLAFTLAILAVATLGAGFAVADTPTQPADLDVSQPDYVDRSITQDGQSTYQAGYHELTLAPQNFNPDDVVDYGIETSAGQLTFNADRGVYEFDSGGDEGTFELYWLVDDGEETTVSGNETTSSTETRYEATIQIDDATEYAHVPAGSLEEQREAADHWQTFESGVRSIAGDDVDVAEQRDLALALLEFRASPFGAITGDFLGVLTILALTPGGLFVLLLFTILFLLSTVGMRRRLNKHESTMSERAELDKELSDLELSKKKRVLENMDWQDIPGFDDTTARAFRETMGPNPLSGTKRLMSILRPAALVRDRLLAMGQSGWVAVVDREPARTDGGDADTPTDADTDVDTDTVAPIKSVRLVRESTLDDTVGDDPTTEVNTLANPSDELVDALDWNAEPLRTFDLPATTLDDKTMAQDLDALDFEELMTELNVSHLDFDDKGVYGEYVSEFIQSVRDHEFCDEDGRVDETRYVMNQFLHLALVERDLFEVPLLDFMSEGIERELIDHDPIAETKQYVDGVEAGEYT